MPGTPNISSGYTSHLQSRAVNCDQARLLARLQGTHDYVKPTRTTAWPPASSTLELNAQAGCSTPTDVLAFPKTAILSSVYTRIVQDETINRTYRFSEYFRNFPEPCCSAKKVTNAGMPKPSLTCSYRGM